MPDTEFSTKNAVSKFVWSLPYEGFEGSLWRHPALTAAHDGNGISDFDDALDDELGDDPGNGGRLYRVTVEEVEVPEPSWWLVTQDADNDPFAELTGIRGRRVEVSESVFIGKLAVVQATDGASAIAAAQDAWRDLAAKIGGAK